MTEATKTRNLEKTEFIQTLPDDMRRTLRSLLDTNVRSWPPLFCRRLAEHAWECDLYAPATIKEDIAYGLKNHMKRNGL